jgi:RNA polymerase sigma-70 factor, ECF subfamily
LAFGLDSNDGEGLTLARVSPDAATRLPSAAPPPVAAEGLSLDTFLEGIGARAFRFAELGLRHREDALDAVQEAMIRMLNYRDRPAEEWTPLFWSILRSRIVDIQRRSLFRLRWLSGPAKRDKDGEETTVDWLDDHIADSSTPDPSRAHDGREAYQALAMALRNLPRRQREAFTLRILEECDVATTARIMGCGEGAVKTHLSRAREALQTQLEDFR